MAEQSEGQIPRASMSSNEKGAFSGDKLIYNQMKTCVTQAFMFLNEYQWIANSYVAVSYFMFSYQMQ